MKLSIILPCYNEEENVARIPIELLPELVKLNLDYEILLIDDGSTDKTIEVAKSLSISNLRIICHGINKGLGEVMRTAFINASADIIITLDTDFTFHPRLIKLLIDRYNKGDVDIVIGSPTLAGYSEDIPFYRVFISKSANIIYRKLFNKPITSISQILRLYQKKDVENLKIDAKGFDVFAEILFKMIVVNKNRFSEVPAPFTVRQFGVSKLNYKKEFIRHFKLLMKIIFWRIQNLFYAKK